MMFRAWKSVALRILKAEASLESTADRILRKVTNHAVKSLALPTDNLVRQAIPVMGCTRGRNANEVLRVSG
jgi:hypothetical protein